MFFVLIPLHSLYWILISVIMLRSCTSLILPSISRASAVRSFRGTSVRLENTRPEQKDVDRLFTANSQPKRRNALK